MTEAYADLENTLRYYEAADGKPRAHFPFNFILIENLNEKSSAHNFKTQIDKWLKWMPDDGTANWVVNLMQLKNKILCVLSSNYHFYSLAIMINRDMVPGMVRRESTAC